VAATTPPLSSTEQIASHAAVEYRADRLPQRRRLEHRTQVQRLIAHQVHGPRAVDDVGHAAIHRLTAAHHHERFDLDVQPFAPRRRGSDQPLGMLEGVRSGQHDGAAGRCTGDQPPVQFVVGRERATTLQRERAVHRGERTRVTPAARIPTLGGCRR
jgi:hypothetical protein